MPEFPDFDEQYYDDWAAELHEQYVAEQIQEDTANTVEHAEYLGEVPWSDRVDE